MWISPTVLSVAAIGVLLYIAWFFYRVSRGEVIPLKPGFKAEALTLMLIVLAIAGFVVWDLISN